MKLIFALGNPETNYSSTRHNVGFRALNALAGASEWSNKTKFNALVAELNINGEKVILAKPTTYYNEVGVSARKLLDFYKITPETDLLVVHDDLSLPFGTVRVRKQGGDAGNNGIKSINNHVNHPYTRIKIGICNELRDRIDDADFVLGKFSADESDQLDKTIIPHVVELIIQFCKGDLEITSYKNLE